MGCLYVPNACFLHVIPEGRSVGRGSEPHAVRSRGAWDGCHVHAVTAVPDPHAVSIRTGSVRAAVAQRGRQPSQ